MPPNISLIMPCRNEARHLPAVLDSLLMQECNGLEYEIVVADGHSEDRTAEILESYCRKYPKIRMIRNEALFVPSGLNAAIRAARGEIILRVDAHTEYASDYVVRCLEVLKETGADNVGGPARTRASGRMGRAIAAAYHSTFACGGARFHDPEYEGPADTVPYGCWRKETLERVGLFDEYFLRNQDDELNLRITRSGGRIWQSPRIVSWYYPRQKLRALFRQYFQYGFWKVAVLRKHRIPASWRHLVPGAFVFAQLVLWLWTLVALLMGREEAAGIGAALLAGLLFTYVSVAMLAGVATARRHGWDLLPLLPVVFATYHVSYGLGFLSGLASGKRRSSKEPGALIAGVTR